jgi:hypothetical protein
MTAARLRNRERCAGPMWRPSERLRSGWDGEFESPLLQRRVRETSVPQRRTPRARQITVRLRSGRLPNATGPRWLSRLFDALGPSRGAWARCLAGLWAYSASAGVPDYYRWFPGRRASGQVAKRRVQKLNGIDFWRWYWECRKPACKGGPERIADAYHIMARVRAVFTFGVLLRYRDCAELRNILNLTRFPNPLALPPYRRERGVRTRGPPSTGELGAAARATRPTSPL